MLIMLILIIVSGNPAMTFGLPHQPFYVAVAVLFFVLILLKKIKIVSPFSVSIFLFFIFVLTYQSFSFSFYPYVTILGFIVRLFIAYAAVRLIKDFARTYVDVMYRLAILSIIFYVPQQLGNFMGFDFRAIFEPIGLLFGESQYGSPMTIFIYTFGAGESYRNAGFFWEPGAFAGYLNLALIFIAAVSWQYNNRAFWKRFIVLLVCLLSTFSTSGYVAAPLALLLHLQIKHRTVVSTALRITMVTYIVAIGAFVYYAFVWEQPFMKSKVLHSITVVEQQSPGWEADRIGTIFFDLDYIKERPFTGWGLHANTRLALSPYLTRLIETGRGNGMSDFAAKFGLVALFLWMFFVFKYLSILFNGNVIKSGLGLLCIMIVLNGECYLNYPLFLCFFFLFKTVQQKKNDTDQQYKKG